MPTSYIFNGVSCGNFFFHKGLEYNHKPYQNFAHIDDRDLYR